MSEPPRTDVPLLVLAGPTGTGKTEVAVRVAVAIDGEIVGCDALQVYRGFDTATAKPDPRQRETVPHHLVDCLDPDRDFTLVDYVREAEEAIHAIAGRGHVPLIVGGTGLYLRGLLRGVIAAPARDSELRQRLRRIVARGGQGRLHAWLERHDPGSARRISPGDTQRLVRAVEIVRSEGGSWTQRLEREGTWKSGVERYRSVKFILDGDRGCMTERLDARVEAFFEAGLVAEVQRLLLQGVSPAANAFKAIGYREVLAAIQSGDDPDRVRDEVRQNTRRYAKRQRSWFRGEPGMIRLDVTRGLDRVIERVLEEWRRVPPRKPVDPEG